jgi:anti-sigma regulatory factor (Ser/Thr protein kinase)
MSSGKSTEFRLKNNLVDLERVAQDLWTFCRDNGLSEEESADVRLVVDEVVSNVIRHGYADRGPHEIRVHASIAGPELTLEIEDDARAFNPLEAPLPDVSLPVEEKQVGGLGILLTRSVMDRLEYRRSGDHNILRGVRVIRRASQ